MKRKTRKWSYGMIAFVLAANTWTTASVPMAVYAETGESNAEEQIMEVEHAVSSQEELLTIEEIRGSVDSEGTTIGVITAKHNDKIYIQDDTAAIAVIADSLEAEIGDQVTVSGTVEEQEGVIVLNHAVVEELTEAGSIPQPVQRTADELENYPSELVEISNVTITERDSENGTVYQAEDAAGNSFTVIVGTVGLELEADQIYESLKGISVHSDSGSSLFLRSQEDIGASQEAENETNTADETAVTSTADEGADENSAEPKEEEEQHVNEPSEDGADEETKEAAPETNSEIEDGDEPKAQGEAFDLSVLHMNDTHANVENFPSMLTAIQENRKNNSLLLHAGDVFSGTLYFNEFRGKADLELFNLMGIDAMVFGNHEFDLGTAENGHESLSKFVSGANFPFLGTNIDFSGDQYMRHLETNQDLVLEPGPGKVYNTIMKEINGEQVGIFGLTTEDTVNIASPVNVQFHDFKKSAEQAVKTLENAGIDKIIAVTHIGFNSAPAVGNDLRLASEVEGIDIIVGGHSHTALAQPHVVETNANGEEKDPTVIVQAGANANYLGMLHVTFDEEGVITDYEGELLPLENDEGHPQAQEVLKPYKEQVDQTMNAETGAVAMKELTNPRQNEPGEDSVRANETELGNLITDAMLAKAKEKYPETVIAFHNGGGIRAPIAEGPITAGEVISVLPFGNNPVIATLTGQEIKDILEHSVREVPGENGGFLHVSGMRFYFDHTKEPGNRIVSMYLVKDECEFEEIQPDEEYMVTTNAFTGQGGDGFTTFEQAFHEGRVKDIGESDWQQLIDYMVEDLGGVVDPEREGRIVDLMGEEFTGIIDCEPDHSESPTKPSLPEDDENDNYENIQDENSKEEVDDNGHDEENTAGSDSDDDETKQKNGNDRNVSSDDKDDSTAPITGNSNDQTEDPELGTDAKDNDIETTAGDSSTSESDHENGETLPETATNMFTLLAIGFVLTGIGMLILYYKRKTIQ